MDLTREVPRSPKEILGGYVHLARMIDKARAKLAGTLGEYLYPCPLDHRLLEFLGIPADVFLGAVNHRDDDGVVGWMRENGTPRTPQEIEEWNGSFLGREPDSEESLRHFLELRDHVVPHRTDIRTWVDLLDADEGRTVSRRD